ncbi:MAG: zinc ABC transporter substrate-binding protein [Deltaproteobacteria bacterium]|nr:zinc ABC transporter substrate-binding protein [Deltaproteobacteria bacterium]
MNRLSAPGIFAIVLCFCLAGVAAAPAAGEAPLGVFVAILPQASFVERIGGDAVSVEVLVGPGQSPHTYELAPRQMASLGKARLFFTIGLPLEETIVKRIVSTLPNLKIVDTRSGVLLLAVDDRNHRHRAGDYRAGEEENVDPHIWLDPKRVKIQAVTICQALAAADPARASMFVRNLQLFLADLDRLDREIGDILAPLSNKKVYVYHPSFGYFCESYGLLQEAVEQEGKEPAPRMLARFMERAKKEEVKIIFVQPQFSSRNAETLARAIGGAVVPIDPLPRDYLGSLRETARRIREGLAR